MRYTTIIDITETPAVYRNAHARLVYLHLCLKAGYRDSDRDRVTASIRTLARDTGLTIAATRHALRLLLRHQLLTRAEEGWEVRKFVQPESISKRQTIDPKNIKESEYKVAEERRRIQDELQKLRRWYADFQQRGDEASMAEVTKKATKLKKRLKELPDV